MMLKILNILDNVASPDMKEANSIARATRR